MRIVAVGVIAVALAAPRVASACVGLSPPEGTVLPPRPHLVYFIPRRALGEDLRAELSAETDVLLRDYPYVADYLPRLPQPPPEREVWPSDRWIAGLIAVLLLYLTLLARRRLRSAALGVIVAALALAAPRAAEAECGRHYGLLPLDGSALPLRPHLVYFIDREGLRDDFRTELSAAIDGVSAAIRVEVLSGPETWAMYEIEVLSDRTGRLEIRAPFDEVSTYEIRAGAVSGPPHVVAYWRGQRDWSCSWEDAAKIQIDAPAIAYRVRWRTRGEREIRTTLLPALEGWGFLVLGKVNCAGETIPVEAMRQGVQLEVSALLPDGSEQEVEGLPRWLALEELAPIAYGWGFNLVDAEVLLRAYPYIADYLPPPPQAPSERDVWPSDGWLAGLIAALLLYMGARGAALARRRGMGEAGHESDRAGRDPTV
jgi:hypothetical protein